MHIHISADAICLNLSFANKCAECDIIYYYAAACRYIHIWTLMDMENNKNYFIVTISDIPIKLFIKYNYKTMRVSRNASLTGNKSGNLNVNIM